jgi:hypothetical protein
MSTIEELLGRISSGSGLENREYGRRDPLCWPRGILYRQNLALTWPARGGRSVGIVCSRTKATELVSYGKCSTLSAHCVTMSQSIVKVLLCRETDKVKRICVMQVIRHEMACQDRVLLAPYPCDSEHGYNAQLISDIHLDWNLILSSTMNPVKSVMCLMYHNYTALTRYAVRGRWDERCYWTKQEHYYSKHNGMLINGCHLALVSYSHNSISTELFPFEGVSIDAVNLFTSSSGGGSEYNLENVFLKLWL